MASHDRFGYEWNKYQEFFPHYEEQFLRWMSPLTRKDFQGKRVLDAGCGMGRNSYWVSLYGAREVVAFDYDKRSIEAARTLLQPYPAHVLYQSIYDIDYANEFDIVFSVGVIHHLEYPEVALKKLFRAVSPGGQLVVWVYGKEGLAWLLPLVHALRSVSVRLPPSLLHAVSYLFSIPLFLLTHIVPFRNPYFRILKKMPFRHVHLTVFDQLIPRVAKYWTHEEVLQLAHELPDPKHVEIFPVAGYSWTMLVTKL